MKSWICLVVLVLGLKSALSQLGIKNYPQPGSQTGNYPYNSGGYQQVSPYQSQQPHFNSARQQFLNESRSRMAPGICYDEVPTSMLVRGGSVVPAGNGSNPSLSRIQVCCKGYLRNMHNFRLCDPICINECVNGICVAPDICECYPDHVRNLAGFCIPTCPIGCGNGDCVNNQCVCKPGYQLDSVHRKFCVPICSRGCGEGNCTAPETCACKPGQQLTANGCQADCGQSCRNGRCIRPGVCECSSGYTFRNGVCEPQCSRGCQDGVCTAPETCTCQSGRTLDSSRTRCVVASQTASCNPNCVNGVCSGYNQCSCPNGYINSPHLPHVCEPHCPGGCPNGICSAPNFCICRPGFVKDQSRKAQQICVRAN